ncbi:MAG: hypothetical protein AAF789_12325, partial [Bacteroidota bacterium]
MKKFLIILFVACSSVVFAQHIEGHISRPGGTAQILSSPDFCIDTLVQVNHNLQIQPYGFEEIHYDSIVGWIPANLQNDTLAHDAYLVEIIDINTFVVMYCGSIQLPDGHNLHAGQYYKLQTDGTIADTIPAIGCLASVGHLHQDNIFRFSPDFLVLCGGDQYSSAGSGGSMDYISNVSLNTNEDSLIFTSVGNAFEGAVPLPISHGGNGDADWFDVTTDAAPSDISDNIYTLGDVGIGTSDHTFYGLTIDQTLPNFLLLRNPSLNAVDIVLEGP